MNKTLQSIMVRLNNKGTILSLAALVVTLLVQCGLVVDSERVVGIVNTVCSILILLGVLNDPTQSTRAYIPGISDRLIEDSEQK